MNCSYVYYQEGVWGLLLRQSIRQTFGQKIDPKIILANNILACNTLELSEAIEQELAENPALERPEEDICGSCTMPKELCSACPLNAERPSAAEPDDTEWRDWYASEIETRIDAHDTGGDDDFDPISNMCSQRTVQDYLLEQLRAAATGEQVWLGEYIIGGINETGYLDGDLEEFAASLKVDVQRLEDVLTLIQGFDPPGVGARSLQECLLIQLRNLEEDEEGNALALRMVRDYWADTAARRAKRLAHQLKAPERAVLKALDYIRDNLTPYPGEGFRAPWDTKLDNVQTVQPDIIVRRTVAGYEVDVLMNDYQMVAINSKYREAYAGIRNGGVKDYSDDERRHVVEYVERADTFIRSILQRRKTLRGITKHVVEYQQGYVETSQKVFLRPLTRTQVAKALGIHESTVSRATANKWVQLPSEEVVSFELFFNGSMSVRDVIGEIIASENKARPLSDQEIAEMLQERGMSVARRTVMKYREAQNILSSRQRRRAS